MTDDKEGYVPLANKSETTTTLTSLPRLTPTHPGLYFSLRSSAKRDAVDVSTIIPDTYFLGGSSTTGAAGAEDGAEACEMARWAADANATVGTADDYWIIKPAAGSNQGDGIKVIASCATEGATEGTTVVQQLETMLESSSEEAERRGW